MFTIGAFARLAGVSPKMLRTYDARGLFRPVWVDRASGYRYYSPAQLPALRRIVALRDMGVGRAEIEALSAGGDDLRSILERRRAELERERREIERRLAALDISVGDAVEPAAAAGEPRLDVVVRPLAAEPVATLSMARVADGDTETAFNELEAHVRDIGARAARPPGAILGDGVEIFVPVTRPIEPTDRIGQRRLPACRAATAIVRGPYDALGAAGAHLERWVAGAGLDPAAPMRILYLQFGADPRLRVPDGYVVESARDYVTELQLPVTTRPPSEPGGDT
jgi:DNA-binding transcriptional MerR regulator